MIRAVAVIVVTPRPRHVWPRKPGVRTERTGWPSRWSSNEWRHGPGAGGGRTATGGSV